MTRITDLDVEIAATIVASKAVIGDYLAYTRQPVDNIQQVVWTDRFCWLLSHLAELVEASQRDDTAPDAGYRGCRGGRASQPPRGEHSPCCATMHDTAP